MASKHSGFSPLPVILWLAAACAFVCLSPVNHACAAEKIAARVNGMPITERQVDEAVAEILPQALFHSNVSPEKKKEFRRQALEELVDRLLYYQAALQQGVKLGKGELEAAEKKVMARFPDRRGFEDALKAGGFTGESFRKELEVRLLSARYFDREVIEKAKITDEALREYYEQNKKKFFRPEAFRLRHILIKVPPDATKEEKEKLKKDAEDVLAKARKGEDFEGLAYKYSMDDWRVKGGDLGLLHKGRLDPALDEAADKLKVGQISGLIRTIYGYHIIKLEEKLPPAQMSFDEIKGKLRQKREGERAKELKEALLKELKGKAKIEIY